MDEREARLWKIRLAVYNAKQSGLTEERRYEGDAYADRIFLLNEIDSLRESIAKALSVGLNTHDKIQRRRKR